MVRVILQVEPSEAYGVPSLRIIGKTSSGLSPRISSQVADRQRREEFRQMELAAEGGGSIRWSLLISRTHDVEQPDPYRTKRQCESMGTLAEV